jgi:hypothetical protein
MLEIGWFVPLLNRLLGCTLSGLGSLPTMSTDTGTVSTTLLNLSQQTLINIDLFGWRTENSLYEEIVAVKATNIVNALVGGNQSPGSSDSVVLDSLDGLLNL